MKMFDVKQKEIDQVKKKEELKSTNPLKVNKRKRKQKDIIMKLIDNLPNHLKDKKRLFTKIERSIIYTQNYSLVELTKKIEILNLPLDIDKIET